MAVKIDRFRQFDDIQCSGDTTSQLRCCEMRDGEDASLHTDDCCEEICVVNAVETCGGGSFSCSSTLETDVCCSEWDREVLE